MVAADASPDVGTVLLVRGDWVYEEALIVALGQRPGTVLLADDGTAVAAHVSASEAGQAAAALTAGRAPMGLSALTPAELAFNKALRKRAPPVLVRLTPATVREVEARTFAGSYKGVTDLVTKYLWPAPAQVVTRWCAIAGLVPNQVTFAGFLLVIAAFGLFWYGHFGWGLACAWVMTFLDTVDGKLARVTLTSSKFGNLFDHGIDLIHPPFWWWAWWEGLNRLGVPAPWAMVTLCAVVVGYWLQRAEEGAFIRLFKVEMHAWRPFDSFFRLITARRNPNLILLTGAWAVGRPDVGLWLVGVWTLFCLGVHGLQVAQAALTPREQLISWLAR